MTADLIAAAKDHVVRAQSAAFPGLDGVVPRVLNSVGVIGGGTMGAGIATACLLAGMSVVLVEMSDSAADAARERVAGNLGGALKRGKITQEAYDAMLSVGLRVSASFDDLSDVDLVIEAVFEDMAVKKEVFGKLNAICKSGCVLATNTSYLDVDEIAVSTSRPADVVGLHFFSPAHIMRLLEIVVADETAADVIATGALLGEKLKKVSVRAGVCDGFIGNRMLAHYRDAAGHMVLDGASPFQIDKALVDFGFAMGPFAVSDLAGLDIGWATRKRKAPHRHPAERVPTYIDRLCEQGHFGRKTGEGYYIYNQGQRDGVPNPKIADLVAAEQAELGITPRDFTDQEIVQRYMCAMVNEAARILEEGIAARPLDVDAVLLFGYGFPRHRGGPMFWADGEGLDKILADVEGYAAEDAWFWQPAPLLAQLAREGRQFGGLNAA